MSLFVTLLKIAMVNILGGLMYGYAIGFVGVYDTYVNINTNCTHLETEVACHSVQHASCIWGNFAANDINGTSKCYFDDIKNGVDCGAFSGDINACGKHDVCAYNHNSQMCEHAIGWSPTKTGIFAGAMIIGGMIGSFAAPPILKKLGRKRPILFLGILALFSAILMSISRAVDSYALLIFARVLLGIASGVACVVCPMYVNEMADDEHRGPLGVTFQISITFGIMLAALIGLAIAPTDFSVDLKMETRFQVFINLQTLFSFLVVVLGAVMPESDKVGEDDATLQEEAPAGPEYSWGDMAGPLTGAFFVAVTLQMTGINAIMNYAPKITAAAGLSPLLGNFIVMLWNFVTTIVSIPLTKKFPLRTLFLGGTVIASAACLLTGIPVYPGVIEADTARHLIVGVGIIIFIAAFEITIGPTFYVLAQEMFPVSFRGKGSSFAVVTQFIFNIIINVFFPIAVAGLSGGNTGNQNKGMGIVFMFFGGCGVVSLLVLIKKLHPFEEGESPYVEIK